MVEYSEVSSTQGTEDAICRCFTELCAESLCAINLFVKHREHGAHDGSSRRRSGERLKEIVADAGIPLDVIAPLMKVSEVVYDLDVRADAMPQDVLLAIWRAKPDRWPDVFDEVQVRASPGASATTETVKAVIDDLEAWRRKPRAKASSKRAEKGQGKADTNTRAQKDQEESLAQPSNEADTAPHDGVQSDGPANEVTRTTAPGDSESNPKGPSDAVENVAPELNGRNPAQALLLHLKSNYERQDLMFIAEELPKSKRLTALVHAIQQELPESECRWLTGQLRDYLSQHHAPERRVNHQSDQERGTRNRLPSVSKRKTEQILNNPFIINWDPSNSFIIPGRASSGG